MTLQERQRRSDIRRKKQVAKQKLVISLIAIVMIAAGSIFFGSTFTSAKESEDKETLYKYHKSIVIESGDSLWTIAREYCTDKSIEIHDYVEELKELNNLSSDQIHAGQHLLVVYYDTEFK